MSVNAQLNHQQADALRRISQAEGQYSLAYLHAEHHALINRLAKMDSPIAADLAEQLQSSYVQYLDALEAYNNVERVQEVTDEV